MNGLRAAWRSSIGKKAIMAASGMSLAIFLLFHLLGNATIFWGRDSFTAYANHLQGLGPLLPLLEIGLLLLFLLHIALGLHLTWANRQARPQRYALYHSRAGRGWGARTMPYSGVAILTFLLLHLFNFRFAFSAEPLAGLVKNTLTRPGVALFYLLAMALLSLHTSHGFWSLGQTLGLNHPKYNRFLLGTARLASLLAGGIFALIPLLALFSHAFLR